ncbi:LolA-like outer membrane lipoprotein chaperone [Campylobacter insulaenigrae]|uniref:Outer membrane lipoprotein carrier protein n=1 Tax=Campylobacter insulaenigrae NCTC 12927 TaxID=1031564 RepID=A0A0A8GZT1_9BACT|nr:LolA-like outer membrane lipoprotein chaperone [Campylobacter insulaenigrae]AJC87433.1 outer membrane lipoprotein carrier protein [Campylobacter insulaenigrae NCTC 12927]MCR6572551.1 LolA-like outer membrane lipoprotein chaperone [Campylobacter insulaenigrae]MCR6573520.1 LolA-like outer membrane lipoprotein chaperone [Campylobacter insulaenigrae]MCR6580025.1 LolA-like outer membrane lipoprotein chaperone [Campylobacter insulaenigrae]MCR6581427.1 LolA-like outer membrane lipoprotein chaperon
MKYLFVLIFIFSQLLAFDINFKNFSSDFIQKVYNNNSSIEYKGNFIISQNKAFWNYIYPNSKQIYINQHEITIIEPQLEQVIFTKIQNLPNLQQIFKKAKKITEETYEANYENVKYKINFKNNKISNISYTDELQNSVAIYLFNQKIDEKIDEKKFIPKIPNHYDIVNN